MGPLQQQQRPGHQHHQEEGRRQALSTAVLELEQGHMIRQKKKKIGSPIQILVSPPFSRPTGHDSRISE